MSRAYTLTIRNRAGALVIGVAVVGLGVLFLTVGIAILAGLAVAGGLIGTGFRWFVGGGREVPQFCRVIGPDRSASKSA